MTRKPSTSDWHPASWTTRSARQQPRYASTQEVEKVLAVLSRLPPLVTSWEVETLKKRLAEAQRGEAFVLQGGDCAESFDDCTSDSLARKLKILLQTSLVLLHGLQKRIVRISDCRSISPIQPYNRRSTGAWRDAAMHS